MRSRIEFDPNASPKREEAAHRERRVALTARDVSGFVYAEGERSDVLHSTPEGGGSRGASREKREGEEENGQRALHGRPSAHASAPRSTALDSPSGIRSTKAQELRSEEH